MAETDIRSAALSDLTNVLENYSVPAQTTDSPRDQDETEWTFPKWTQYLGYYKQIPEIKKAIDSKAVWTLGKGFIADPETTIALNYIRGNGVDTFNTILKNMLIVRQINGDAFAEIVRDTETGKIINLKPLSPQNFKMVFNRKGQIKRYEQLDKTGKGGKVVNTFKPNEIFHLTRDRVADEMHGVSVIESVEKIILARNEVLDDLKKVMHRFVKPMVKFTLDTDDPTKIQEFIAKCDQATNKGENLYLPKGVVEHEVIAVPGQSILNPLPYLNELSAFFFQAIGIPSVILGSSANLTESNAKVSFISFQQVVEDEQLDIETQVWEQLGFRIELNFPTTFLNELISDKEKDGSNQGLSINPSDLNPNSENQ